MDNYGKVRILKNKPVAKKIWYEWFDSLSNRIFKSVKRPVHDVSEKCFRHITPYPKTKN